MRTLLVVLAALMSGCSGTVYEPRGCTPANCQGCCSSAGVCELGLEVTACGKGGQQCSVCTGAQVCGQGACGPAMSGSGGSGNTGGGTTSTTGGGTGNTGGGTGSTGGGGSSTSGGGTGSTGGGTGTTGGGMGTTGGGTGNTGGGGSGNTGGGGTITPGTGATTFDALYPSTFTLDSGNGAVAQNPLTRPAKSTNIMTGGYVDTPFGTQLRRITDVSDSHDQVDALRHEYSRRQAFNVDSTRFLAQASNGFWYLYDSNTLQVIPGGHHGPPGEGAIDGMGGDCEPQWHPTDPDKVWFTETNGGLVWYERNVATGVTSTLFDLTQPLHQLGWTSAGRAWFKGEGRPSLDGRWWALMIETSNFGMLGLIMYDRQTNTITGAVPITNNAPDHISTSALGNYAVASWYGNAAASLAEEASRPVEQAGGVRAYDRTMTHFNVMAVIGEHSDLALDAQGNEVFVMVSFHGQNDGVTDGSVFVRKLDGSSTFTTKVNAYDGPGAGVHLSGTAFNRPGWAVVSRYEGVGSGAYDGQVLAVELQAPGRVLRLAHHRSSVADYFAEPHATANRDLTRVVFASDWGGTAPKEDYEILLPSWAIPQ